MRILNLEGLHLVPAFRALGHEVLTVGPSPSCDVSLAEPLSTRALWDLLDSRGFRPDLAFWCDLCRPPWIMGLETLPGAVIGLSVDQYCNPWHVPYSACFDAVLVAQKDYLRLFQDPRLPRPARWLPLFCDPDQDYDRGAERDIPVSFVGTLNPPLNPGRKPFLEGFRRAAPLVHLTGEYAPIFGRSRMVLNQSAVGELNYRLFQAMSCGAAVLTEATENGLFDLFEDGRDLLTYPRGDAAAAARVALEALASPRLADIAASGQKMARNLHSTEARARSVLALATALLRSGAPAWRRENAQLVREEVARAYAMLASDEALPFPPETRRHYADAALRLAAL